MSDSYKSSQKTLQAAVVPCVTPVYHTNWNGPHFQYGKDGGLFDGVPSYGIADAILRGLGSISQENNMPTRYLVLHQSVDMTGRRPCAALQKLVVRTTMRNVFSIRNHVNSLEIHEICRAGPGRYLVAA